MLKWYSSDDKKHAEYFQMLVHIFEIPHLDNMKILKALIYMKDDILPLEVGTTKTRVDRFHIPKFFCFI